MANSRIICHVLGRQINSTYQDPKGCSPFQQLIKIRQICFIRLSQLTRGIIPPSLLVLHNRLSAIYWTPDLLHDSLSKRVVNLSSAIIRVNSTASQHICVLSTSSLIFCNSSVFLLVRGEMFQLSTAERLSLPPTTIVRRRVT